MTYNVDNITDLKKAIASSEANITINVTKSFKIDSLITIPDNKNITITTNDRENCILMRDKDYLSYFFSLYATTTATLTLANIILDGNRDNISQDTNSFIISNGTVNINDSILRNNNSGANGAGAIWNGSRTVNTNSSTFINNSGKEGGVIRGSGGNLNFKNTTFINNTALNGGAISAGSETVIENSSFKNNTASNNGGAINFEISNRSLTIIDSEFLGNKATDGGSISQKNKYYGSTCTIKGNTSFINNSASNNGGAIYIDKLESLSVEKDGIFKNNIAKEGYIIHPNDISLHNKYVLTKTFTMPFEYGYNNYDINYTNGTIYELKPIAIELKATKIVVHR